MSLTEKTTPQPNLPSASAAAASETSDTMACQAFTIFSKLPTELRFYIWDIAIASRLRPRLVRLEPRRTGTKNLDLTHVRRMALTLRSIAWLERRSARQRFAWPEILKLCPEVQQLLIIIQKDTFTALTEEFQMIEQFEVYVDSSGGRARWRLNERPDLRTDFSVSGCIIYSSCFGQTIDQSSGWKVITALAKYLRTCKCPKK